MILSYSSLSRSKCGAVPALTMTRASSSTAPWQPQTTALKLRLFLHHRPFFAADNVPVWIHIASAVTGLTAQGLEITPSQLSRRFLCPRVVMIRRRRIPPPPSQLRFLCLASRPFGPRPRFLALVSLSSLSKFAFCFMGVRRRHFRISRGNEVKKIVFWKALSGFSWRAWGGL